MPNQRGSIPVPRGSQSARWRRDPRLATRLGGPTGVAPVVEAVRGPDAAAGPRNDAADGIQIAEPARLGEIRAAIEATDGDAIAVDADATADALQRLRSAGLYTEPTCAVAPAALERYRAEGVLEDDADVVVPLTGSGLKDPA